jgi:HEAT repeat protein
VTDNPTLKTMAIKALGDAVVSDSILQVRLKAIAALAKIRDEEAIPYLVKALDDSNPEIRAKAVEAIGEICCPMSENPKNQNFNFYAQVGNVNANDITTQGDQIGIQHNYAPETNLAEAAVEIQLLLDQLAKTYPTNTETDKKNFVVEVVNQIKQRPTLRDRTWSALKSGSIEAVKVIANHPTISIPVEIVRGWIEAEADIGK